MSTAEDAYDIIHQAAKEKRAGYSGAAYEFELGQ